MIVGRQIDLKVALAGGRQIKDALVVIKGSGCCLLERKDTKFEKV